MVVLQKGVLFANVYCQDIDIPWDPPSDAEKHFKENARKTVVLTEEAKFMKNETNVKNL